MTLTLDTLCRQIADYYHVSMSDLLGRSRLKTFAEARHAFCWIAGFKLGHSSTTVGEFLNRDHSTVLHSWNVVENDRQAQTHEWKRVDYFVSEFCPHRALLSIE